MNHRYFQLSRRVFQNIMHSNYPQSLETYLPRRWAGHAKWQNVKADKEQAAKLKNMHFSKLIKDIGTAVREGGDNPAINSKLRHAIEAAKKLSMTNATIQKAIERSKSKAGSKPFWIACKGPLNLQVGFEITYLQQHTFQNDCGSKLRRVGLKVEKNCLDYFTERGIIVCKPLENVESSYDKALEDGIEVGASDVFEMNNKMLVFECNPDRIDSTESQLSKKGYVVESSGTEIEFHETTKLSEEEFDKIKTVLDKIIENHDEVQRFCHNVEIQ